MAGAVPRAPKSHHCALAGHGAGRGGWEWGIASLSWRPEREFGDLWFVVIPKKGARVAREPPVLLGQRGEHLALLCTLTHPEPRVQFERHGSALRF